VSNPPEAKSSDNDSGTPQLKFSAAVATPPPAPPPGVPGLGNPPPPMGPSSSVGTSFRVRVTMSTGSDPANGIDTVSIRWIAVDAPNVAWMTSKGSNAGFGTAINDSDVGNPL
jgi:hypothetical protein